MDVVELIGTVAALAGLVLTLTQLLKMQAGLKGKKVLVVSALLGAVMGAVLASGGIAGLAVLAMYPPALSGAILGLLAGLVASGGKDTVTGIQINGAKARARADAEYGCPPGASTPASSASDGWEPAALDDLAEPGRSR